VRNALISLPWVEKDSVVPDLRTQTVRFAVKDKNKFNLDEVQQAVTQKAGTQYRVSVQSGP
jgi:hypothetical protein